MGTSTSKQIYTVYILQSLKHATRFYIHSTSHPHKLQRYIHNTNTAANIHNNNINKSKHWKLIVIVYGFTGRPSMTMFAQRLSHPTYTSKLSTNEKQSYQPDSLQSRIILLYQLISNEHYKHRQLHIQYIDDTIYQQYHTHAIQQQHLPEHIDVQCTTLNLLQSSNNKHPQLHSKM